jgi:hypothetical protein
MGLPEVSTILWRERHLLELLVFKLDAQQLLIGSGRERWLAHATDEVEAVLEELRHTELLRAVEVDAVATSLGLGPNPSLAELAEAAPAPFDGLLAQHRDALLELAAEVRERSRTNRDVLARGQAALRTVLASASAAAQPPGASPAGDDVTSGVLVDRVI